jgi:hypothetical protein
MVIYAFLYILAAPGFLYQPVSAPTLYGKPLVSNMPVNASTINGIAYK